MDKKLSPYSAVTILFLKKKNMCLQNLETEFFFQLSILVEKN
ncbi:MAG: hypothetical protein Edafosvirus12_17 [Edafosvirus sp.]|uniref:Uncharacterized protein n=1 Tax=Edafosvirus sp. TaxID=2487765 RepID=A0A3G4ZU39_9VIRU|nr:MAG: hypothetical protein Edafosvirus12_17 [Edafosvirus sp.]